MNDIVYRMARLVRNTDKLPPLKFAMRGIKLLGELRQMDSESYDNLVKGVDDECYLPPERFVWLDRISPNACPLCDGPMTNGFDEAFGKCDKCTDVYAEVAEEVKDL